MCSNWLEVAEKLTRVSISILSSSQKWVSMERMLKRFLMIIRRKLMMGEHLIDL